MIDLNTFGKSRAAQVLVMMINETGHPSKKIGDILTSFSRTLHELEKIDSRIGIGLAKVSCEYYKKKCSTLEGKFSTYTLNVLSSNFKVWLEKQNASTPYKIRKLKQ